MKRALLPAFALFLALQMNVAQAQKSGSGGGSGKGSPPAPGEVEPNNITVSPTLRGLWVVKVAQNQNNGVYAYFKVGQAFALVGRDGVLPYGAPGLEVVRCDYTRDANGSNTQVIALNNGFSWVVSPQLGNNPNWLVQVFHRATNREVSRLLIEIR